MKHSASLRDGVTFGTTTDPYRKPGEDAPAAQSGTSIFDPVLCELIYRWFCPLGGAILDPFAGGSVRGIVAAKLGRNYTGIELRAEQIEANREQAARILTDAPGPSGLIDDPGALTPVQEMPGGFWLKRDDLFAINGSRGGKGRALKIIAERAKAHGAGLVTACSRQSPMSVRLARTAALYGIPCRIYVASSTSLTDQEAEAVRFGAELVKGKVNYLSALLQQGEGGCGGPRLGADRIRSRIAGVLRRDAQASGQPARGGAPAGSRRRVRHEFGRNPGRPRRYRAQRPAGISGDPRA